MLNKLLTIAVASTAFVWFHLTCYRFLDDAELLSLAGVLLVILLASVTEIIPRSSTVIFFSRQQLCTGPTAWEVVLAATESTVYWDSGR